MVRHRYTKQIVTHRDLLHGTIGRKKEEPITYMLDRTLKRPRDIIAFFNLCAAASTNDPVIRPQTLVKAEAIYSEQRLTAVQEEWSAHYAYLRELCGLLKQRPISFPLVLQL
jgi:hypothetical protein